MPTPPLSQDIKDRILELSKSGIRMNDIAKQLGIASSTVSNYASANSSVHGKYSKKERADHLTDVHRMADAGTSTEAIAKDLKLSRDYVRGLLKTKKPVVASDETTLPPPHYKDYSPYVPKEVGEWLVLCDVHVPYHDTITVQHAIREAKDRNVVGIVLNGDFLDSHEISDHDKDASAPRYAEEIKTGIAVIRWIRSQLPNVKIVFKLGNHEERLDRYILSRAPALFDLDFATVESLLHFKEYGIQVVRDKRPIMLGKLHLLHGHEYRGGGGVNPARWIYLRARSVAMVGHFHRSSEHHERNIANKLEASWSVGCACSLTPSYAPLNNWNHGYAFVSFDRSGDFHVLNRKVFNGRVT